VNALPVAARRRGPEGSAEPPIRLMVVDDSAVVRAVLSRMLSSDPEFEVVAQAGNAGEALDALRSVEVDIVLLDVEMPGASGIDALPDIIRAGQGARVLIVSSMAEDGAEIVVRALAQGAADTLPKPGASSSVNGRFSQVLADRIRRIGRAGAARAAPSAGAAPVIRLRSMPDTPPGCVALGASTGGLHALVAFLGALPGEIGAPILVTQHLPAMFMPYFARQLESASGRCVRVARDGQTLDADAVLVAPGDAHLCVERIATRPRIRLDRRRAPSGCCPSVDPMLESVAELYGAAAIGVMLSGMGRDGLIGARRLVDLGGAMLAQDEASSAIWGMPRGVAENGLASAVLAPAALARRIGQRAEGRSWN
jgi:two-component system chemotaxis response regulator CheB